MRNETEFTPTPPIYQRLCKGGVCCVNDYKRNLHNRRKAEVENLVTIECSKFFLVEIDVSERSEASHLFHTR